MMARYFLLIIFILAEFSACAAYSSVKTDFDGFQCGMGIGGWLTNYKRFTALPQKWRRGFSVGDFEHFESYITEADVKNIADMGFDHIRVGFDQIVLEESAGVWREKTFGLLRSFAGWCEKYKLNLVLNLHKAVGNYCDVDEPVSLFDSRELQDGFVALWLEIERRFHSDKAIAFELLNEVRGNGNRWNELAKRTVAELRKLNADRKIIVGGSVYNSCWALPSLVKFDDPNVIYTFHFYDPFEFTHQRGVLQSGPIYYNRKMFYPSSVEPYNDYRKFVEGRNCYYGKISKIDRAALANMMAPAFDFVRKNPDKVLWCGEFGVIRHVDPSSRERWFADVISLLKEHKIPYCVWNYLSTPNDGNRFSLVDDDSRKILSPKLLEILLGKSAAADK